MFLLSSVYDAFVRVCLFVPCVRLLVVVVVGGGEGADLLALACDV